MAARAGHLLAPLAAVQFLTRLPVPVRLVQVEGFGASLAWFPAVGALLGVLLAGADALLRLILDPLLASALVVALLLALTGALHADGLVDTADAVFAHATPERRLEIMRDPRAGSFGVAALASTLLVKVAAVDALPLGSRAATLVLAPVLGRLAIVVAATYFPYGRASGLGAPIKAAARPTALVLPVVVTLATCLLLGPVGIAVAGLAVSATLLVARWLMTKLPGLTGDSYGAICEATETLALVAVPPLLRAMVA